MKTLQALKTGKLDRYIIRKFLGTFFFALMLIILITVVFDISEKIDDFIEKKAPLRAIIFDYYLNFIPYFISMFSSLFIFISVIFFTSKMAAQSEIIAILSSGTSFLRFFYPYFISACFLAAFTFVINDIIIPPANTERIEFENKYLKGTVVYLERNLHKQIEPGIFVYIQTFSNTSGTAYLFSMEKFDDDRLVSKLISDNAQWDDEKQKWHISQYCIRNIDSLGRETLQKGAGIDTTINLSPDEFRRNENFMETMSIAQLRDYIGELRMQGVSSIKTYIIELHKRIAAPFSTFILTLIGATLSTRKLRGGIGFHIAIGIALCFIYILFMQFSVEFATKGNLPPMLAAWVPNIIFGIVGLILYRLAPK